MSLFPYLKLANTDFLLILHQGISAELVREIREISGNFIFWVDWEPWFPMIVSLLKNFSILLPPNILTLPSKRSGKHPLYSKMKLLAVHLSGKASETQTFQEKLQMLSQIRGEQPPKVVEFSGDGLFMQVQGTRIPILQM